MQFTRVVLRQNKQCLVQAFSSAPTIVPLFSSVAVYENSSHTKMQFGTKQYSSHPNIQSLFRPKLSCLLMQFMI